MRQTTRQTTTGLRARRVWGQWCRLVYSRLRAQKAPTVEWSEKIAEALGQGPASLDYRLAAIARGYALMRAAHLDFKPAMGRYATECGPSRLDTVRGLQWRLVLSVAGFEMFLRGRIGQKDKKLKIWKLVKLAIRYVSLEPPPPPMTPPPNRRKGRSTKLESWLDDIPLPTRAVRFAEFFGLNEFEEPVLLGWLRGARKPWGWEEHLQLATALRNVTAHGALSAKKARELRMGRAFDSLPCILLDFAAATLAKPVQDLSQLAHESAPRHRPRSGTRRKA